MDVLGALGGPDDVRRLNATQLRVLAAQIRTFLVDRVGRSGGHLGPNLGVVELTIALHRTFDSPRTPIIFDTGHQAYVHKLLTGRRDRFGELRASDGLSGYPSRAESPHDHVENSHASTALAYADGLSKALASAPGSAPPVVAVVGDGALTGGMAWEALNNIGAARRRVVVVLNDNGRSYSPTAGALPRHLARLADRATGYAALVDQLGAIPPAGPAPTDDPGSLFEALGLRYVGPIDGHDVAALESALRDADRRDGPVVVHCLTRKGHGYPPAEADAADHFHTVGVLDPVTGREAAPQQPTWTDAFGDELVRLAADRPDLVAISAAMLGPTGLQRFADAYPGRCFDVGIAEQHAVTSAAGMAAGGLHPVVALYATFANRAFDQILLDVGLHGLPVTLVLDRAGITGPDGPSHHGVWDLAMLGSVPGLRVAAPRDTATLREELAEAVAHHGPSALRFPKGVSTPPIPARDRWRGIDVLRAGQRPDVLLVAVGATAGAAVDAAASLGAAGIESTTVDPRWVLPIDAALVDLAAHHRLVVTVEDGLREGGVGSRLVAELAARGSRIPVSTLGLPIAFVPAGSRAELLRRYCLDATGIVDAVRAALGRSLPDATLAPVGRGTDGRES